MNVLSAWKDAVSLLEPKQLKLFALVTLKSLIDLYVVWGTYWWWLALFYALCAGPENSCPLAGSWLGSAVSWKLHYLGLVTFTLVLMGRPSVGKKNYAYCAHYFPLRYSLYLLAAFAVYGVMLYASEGMFAGLVEALLLCASMLFYLFFLDSVGGWQAALLSLWHALKMLLYAAPLFLLVIMGMLLFSYLGATLYALMGTGTVSAVIIRVLYTLSVPLGICVIINLYIKQVHEHFVLYFGEQGKGYHD